MSLIIINNPLESDPDNDLSPLRSGYYRCLDLLAGINLNVCLKKNGCQYFAYHLVGFHCSPVFLRVD